MQNTTTTEIKKLVSSISKRVYPLTDKEKKCINEYGKMIINRGHLEKEIIQTISKYEQSGETEILEGADQQESKDSSTVQS
jgi:hypothetical protein